MAYTNLSEAQLLRQIVKNDERAFEELYQRYNARLYRYFKRLSGDRVQAQDLLQDLFLRLIQKAHLFDKRYSFSTWIYTIAYHVFINQQRKKTVIADYDSEKYDQVVEKWDQLEFSPDIQIDRQTMLKQIDRYLMQLDADKRHTFILRFQEDLNVSEIAEIMKCPAGTVKSRLHYILKGLAPQLAAFKEI